MIIIRWVTYQTLAAQLAQWPNDCCAACVGFDFRKEQIFLYDHLQVVVLGLTVCVIEFKCLLHQHLHTLASSASSSPLLGYNKPFQLNASQLDPRNSHTAAYQPSNFYNIQGLRLHFHLSAPKVIVQYDSY